MKNKCLLLFFFLPGFLAIAQTSKAVKQGYEALSIFDYFKAKHLFYNSYRRSPSIESAYGLSLIFSRKDNPFYNTDSASKYAQAAAGLYQKHSEVLKLSGFAIDSVSVNNQLKLCMQLCFNEASKSGLSEHWDKFLQQNPLASSEVKEAAVYSRDELEFNKVLQNNNTNSTLLFLKTHPVSAFYSEAFQLHDRQIYEETCANKSAEEFKAFLKKYPNNGMRNTALDELYDIYRKKKDAQGLKFFVSNYKNAPQVNEAWKLLFTLSVRSYSDEELIRFLAKYPQFPLRNTILKELQMSGQKFFIFRNADAFGYIDTNGNIKIPPIYDAAGIFNEELALVGRNDSVWFINKLNERVFDKSFDDAFGFNAGVAPVKFNGSWKFINRQGQVISPEYEEINELSDNVYVLKLKGKYGALDRFGLSRIEARYEYLGSFVNNIAAFRTVDVYGFVSLNGYEHKAEFDWISSFSKQGLAVFRRTNSFGLIRANGDVLLEAKYNQVISADNGIYILVKGKHYGFYSSEGCFLSEIEFDYLMEETPEFYTQNGWFRLMKNKSVGLTDLNGAMRVNFGVYEDCSFFKDGLLKVKKKKKYGYVDRKLQTAIPYQYSYAEDFKDSVAIVKKGEVYELIDWTGRARFVSSQKIQRIYKSYFLKEEGNGKTLVDSRGQLLLEQIEEYEALQAPYFLFTLKNKEIKLLKL